MAADERFRGIDGPRVGAEPCSRRGFLGAAVLVALPGCVSALPTIRSIDLDAIGSDQALLLGRIRVWVETFDCTGDSFVTVSGNPEALLPPSGEVAWVVRRYGSHDVDLMRVETSGKIVFPGAMVLAPGDLRTAINYFGTIEITLTRALGETRASGRTGAGSVRRVDERDRAMAAFVAENPRLGGRIYCHVPTRQVLLAPSAPAP